MRTAARIALVALIGLASMATSRVDDDEPVDAAPTAGDADQTAPDADPNTPDGGADAYRAVAVIGALDRIVVVKADAANDVCAILRLVSPAPQGNFGITTPTNWGIELAGVSQGTTGCLDSPIPQTQDYATSGTGSVTFTVPMGQFYPTTISADATIDFDPGTAPPWAPSSVRFLFTDLPL